MANYVCICSVKRYIKEGETSGFIPGRNGQTRPSLRIGGIIVNIFDSRHPTYRCFGWLLNPQQNTSKIKSFALCNKKNSVGNGFLTDTINKNGFPRINSKNYPDFPGSKSCQIFPLTENDSLWQTNKKKSTKL